MAWCILTYAKWYNVLCIDLSLFMPLQAVAWGVGNIGWQIKDSPIITIQLLSAIMNHSWRKLMHIYGGQYFVNYLLRLVNYTGTPAAHTVIWEWIVNRCQHPFLLYIPLCTVMLAIHMTWLKWYYISVNCYQCSYQCSLSFNTTMRIYDILGYNLPYVH